MKRLFDQTFWRFFFGFILILAVSVSLLAVTGAYRTIKEQIAAFVGVWGARQ